MRRLITTSLFCITMGAMIISVVSCHSEAKKRSANKQELLEDIAHFDIDTIDTTNKEQIGSADVDEVLRHYPELYYAAENVQKFYNKWAETEQAMIATVYVGKDKARVAKCKKNADRFAKRLEERNVATLLDYVLFSSEEPKDVEFVGDEPTSDYYLTIMSSIADGMTENGEHAKTDEMRSAVGYARRAWADYLAAAQRMIDAVPAGAHTRYIKAVNEMVRHHRVDLANRYYPYYTGDTPAWLLKDDATDEDIKQFDFIGDNGLDWFEHN